MTEKTLVPEDDEQVERDGCDDSPDHVTRVDLIILSERDCDGPADDVRPGKDEARPRGRAMEAVQLLIADAGEDCKI